jgi:hypothetical protein
MEGKMLQNIIIIMIVAVTVICLVKRLIKGSCGCCKTCDEKEARCKGK